MKNNIFDRVSFYVILLLTFLLPLFFLPLNVNFYFPNKKLLLIYATGILMILWAIKSVLNKKITFKKAPFLMPFGALILVFIISSLIAAPNRINSLSNQTTIMISLFFFYLASVNIIKEKKQIRYLFYTLIGSSIVLSWLSIFSYLELPAQLSLGPTWLQNKAWTPTGSPISSIIFALILIPSTIYWAFKSNEGTEKILLFTASSLQLLSVILNVSLFLDGTVNLNYLPPIFGWQIAVEGFKNLRTALIGVGPDNYGVAYSLFRPARMNITDMWNRRFNASSNYFFHLLSTVGILGLASYLWLTLSALRKQTNKDKFENLIKIGLGTSLLIQFVFPVSILPLFLLTLFISLLSFKDKKVISIELSPIVYSLAGLTFLLMGFAFYWHTRLWTADYIFRKSLIAAQQNRGLQTYNLQQKAIQRNPFNDNYRISFSQTNFALANSIANQGEEELTDQDKQNIQQLISQSVASAKNAIAINRQNSTNWQNLAGIYRNLLNYAQNAGQWTISAYQGAINTFPTNPQLRLQLGSLYYSTGNYDQAIRHFNKAIDLKPDWANGYYNLSHAYQQKEDWVPAFLNMQQVLALVERESDDYQKVQEEITALKEKLPQQQQQTVQDQQRQESELTTPSPLPSPRAKFEDITLPEDEVAPPPVPEASLETEESPAPEAEQETVDEVATPSAEEENN